MKKLSQGDGNVMSVSHKVQYMESVSDVRLCGASYGGAGAPRCGRPPGPAPNLTFNTLIHLMVDIHVHSPTLDSHPFILSSVKSGAEARGGATLHPSGQDTRVGYLQCRLPAAPTSPARHTSTKILLFLTQSSPLAST